MKTNFILRQDTLHLMETFTKTFNKQGLSNFLYKNMIASQFLQERNTEIMQIKKALLRTLKPIKWYMENT